MRLYTVVPSPVEDLMLTGDGTSLTGLYMSPHAHGPVVEPDWVRADDDPVLAEAARQLSAWFAGDLTDFDLPLAPVGTPFQLAVWQQLRAIPYGETVSYGELARRVGNAKASRAVGLANGRNPISLIVPCHRVVGSNGKLVGYGGGVDRKRYLLAMEARVAGARLPI